MFIMVWSILMLASNDAQSQVFVPNGEPINVATSDFGNKAIRMALNANQEPVVSFGTNGHLYVSKWNNANGNFEPPLAIDPEANIFMSDAEGPRMAATGNHLVLTYMLSGQWTNGARSVQSFDGGSTWSSPEPMASSATEDHFMPCVAIDGNGNPFAGVKVGNNPNSIFEGILRSTDGGNSWLEAVNASDAADGNAVCECCPSLPFWTNGRYYDLVRNNNLNIRDFWLLSSEDGTVWDSAVDIDPLDWLINSCPESGPTVAGPLADGTWLTAYMSAGGTSGQSRVYVSQLDLTANGGAGEWMNTHPVTVEQFESASQNNPYIAVWNEELQSGTPITALAFEQNSGGYDIQLALSGGLSGGSGTQLTDVSVNLTAAWSGQHRRPVIAWSTTNDDNLPLLHIVWQNSSDGTVKYLQGTIAYPLQIPEAENEDILPEVIFNRGIWQLQIPDSWQDGTWRIYNLAGQLTHHGTCNGHFTINLPKQEAVVSLISLSARDGKVWAQKLAFN